MNAYELHKPRTLQRWAKFNAVGAIGFLRSTLSGLRLYQSL